MMRWLVFFILFSIGNNFCFGFNIHREIDVLKPHYESLDSLSNFLKTRPISFESQYDKLHEVALNNNEVELQALLYIYNGSFFYYQRNLDSAKHYFDLAIEKSLESNNKKLKRTATIRRIFCDEFEKSSLEQSRLMRNQLKKSEDESDTINMIYSLNGLGLFYSQMDSTELAMKQYYRGLKLTELTKNRYEQGFILNNLGLMKLELKMLDDAYDDFKKGLDIADKLNNIILEGHLRQNLGYYYLLKDSTDLAEENYQKVMSMGRENNYPSLVISSLINIGALERVKGNHSQSDSLYSVALDYAYKEHFNHAISHIYLGKAQASVHNKKFKDALSFLDSAMVYAEYTSYTEIRLAYHNFKSEIHEELGQDKNALQEFKNYKALNDSLNEVGNMQKMAELQFRYNDEKQEKKRLEEKAKLELKVQESKLEAATYRQNFILIVILLIIIIAGVLIYHYRSKQKKNETFSLALADKLEEERSRIARDLHDGLGQNLIILKNKFMQHQNGKAYLSDEIDHDFSDVIEEVRAISRSLLPPELKRLGLKKAIENMLDNVEKTTDVHINYDLDILNDTLYEQQKSVRIYRIIQELITNTVKHANATAIKLDASINKNELELTYQDNGKSFNIEKWKSSENSIGLRSIVQRLGYLNGSIKFEKPKVGFKVIITISNS